MRCDSGPRRLQRGLAGTPETLCRLHPYNSAAPGRESDTTDAEVYGQVATDEEYAAVADRAALTIVDCGANVGLTSAYLLTRLPAAHTAMAIEPFAANAEMCRRNLAPYGNRAKVIQAAVWNRCTRLALDYTDGNDWGVKVRQSRPGEVGEIEAIDLQAWAWNGLIFSRSTSKEAKLTCSQRPWRLGCRPPSRTLAPSVAARSAMREPLQGCNGRL